MRGVFVTGTGTGVGKTLITAGILRALRCGGIDAGVMKPFQTGCIRRADGRLEAPDVALAAQAAGLDPGLAYTDPDVCPYAFEPPCSPHLAARLAGVTPKVARVVAAARRLGERYRVVIAEGAGGVLVPVNARETMADVMRALDWPVLVVARAGLGTLNETLLTLLGLRTAGLKPLGVVLCDAAHCEDDFIYRDNPATIEAFGGAPVLARVPWLGTSPERHPDVWTRLQAAFHPPILSWEVWQ